MSISSDSADQVMRIMLEGEEICLKASGKAAIEIIKYGTRKNISNTSVGNVDDTLPF